MVFVLVVVVYEYSVPQEKMMVSVSMTKIHTYHNMLRNCWRVKMANVHKCMCDICYQQNYNVHNIKYMCYELNLANIIKIYFI